jgi:TM2 domain-containing membrane protein YozV
MNMATFAYPSPHAVFQMQYESVRRDEVLGVLLALLLGGFGAHHFYLGRTGWGIFYLCLFWTPIPWIIAFIECFFMPERVRVYNAVQAAGLAAALGLAVPAWVAYPGWVAPGVTGQVYSAPVHAAAATGSTALATSAGTLIACGQCGLANPAGSRFCSTCGTSLA